MKLTTRTLEVNGNMTESETDGDVQKTRPEAWPDITSSRLQRILRPLLIALACSGCYSFSDVSQDNKTQLRRSYTLSFVYRLVIFTIVLVCFIQKLTAFAFLPNEAIQFNLLFTLWLLLLLVWYIIFWRASSQKFGKQIDAYKTWNSTIMPKFQELNLEYPIKKVQKRVIILLVFGLLLTLSNTISSGIQFALPTDLSVYTSPLELNGYTIALFCVFQLICSAVWIMPIMYATAITFVLKHAFTVLKKAICTALKQHSCSVPPDFQKLRILHVQLVSLVSEFDSDLGWYYATLCTFNVGISCFVLFQLLRSSLDAYIMSLYLFWLIAILAAVAFATGSAAMLNDEAHAPLETIYYINVSDVNLEKLAQLNLFLSKLTGTQIGFSTCGLLIINKEFILTIAGVFLTYFAVLYTL